MNTFYKSIWKKIANQKRYNNDGGTNKTKDKLEFMEQTSNINHHTCLHIYFFRSVNIGFDFIKATKKYLPERSF
jgi:hypothetical protein